MTIYNVGNETFYNLTEAKAEMKRSGKPGYKTKVYSNGGWVPCGEIILKGSNKCTVAGNHDCSSY